MNRKSNSESIKKLILKIRNKIPSAILRTSLIVGFPNETEKDFEKLYDFVKETKFDKLGVFKYSKEDGTAAATMNGQIHGQTKNKRWNKIMKLQQQISEHKMKEKIGDTYKVIIEGKTQDNRYYIARSYMDVPDMDGVIYIKCNDKLKVGSFAECEIIDLSGEYDLIAKIK